MAALESFVTNIADSIRTASRTTGKIPAQNFPHEILKLTNTADGTATNGSLRHGEIAYANGERLVGTAQTYSGTSSAPGMYSVIKDVTNLYSFANNYDGVVGVEFYNCQADNASRVFYGCKSLREVVNFPSSVINIVSAFQGCENLTSFKYSPVGAVNASLAFAECSSLKTVDIGNTVEHLGNAFRNCTSLEYVECIPATVTNTVAAFNGVETPFDIGTLAISNMSVTNSEWKSYLNCVGNYINANGANAFKSSAGITKVNNILGVTNASNMFYGCENLSYANFAQSVQTLQVANGTFRAAENIADGIIGFGTDEKYDFPMLSDASYMFYGVSPATPVTRRISTGYSGVVNINNSFYSSNGHSSIIINAPNATTLNAVYAFRNCKSENAYINAPNATASSMIYAFANSQISNIYLNIADDLSPTLTNCFLGKVTTVMTNVYVRPNSALNTTLYNSGTATRNLFTTSYAWTLDETNSCYYNATANVYVYYTLTELQSDL